MFVFFKLINAPVTRTHVFYKDNSLSKCALYCKFINFVLHSVQIYNMYPFKLIRYSDTIFDVTRLVTSLVRIRIPLVKPET